MKKQILLAGGALAFFCCSCDMFLTYHLTVTDENGRGIKHVSVTDADDHNTYNTDSTGFITLTKITGGIRPKRTKTVSLHQAGYHDTIVMLSGTQTIQLRKQ